MDLKQVEMVLLFLICYLLMTLLLFCQATVEEFQNLLKILQTYAAASGQHVNFLQVCHTVW